ncbi:hypothetical protein BN1221_01868 [Brenneria goodwinii]|uniref:Uncharacterized protein n=1 Tax=Brenneria goodwinii TaxID=1109412 RepID=A0A0G4JU60_9GAMM|nr:hypothetical protein BN1221_01868 [Brenneria goodwinii]
MRCRWGLILKAAQKTSTTIFQFSEEGIQQVAYEETEHYQITRLFLNNPERMLRKLMVE